MSVEEAYLQIPEYPLYLEKQLKLMEAILVSGVSIYQNKQFYRWVSTHEKFDGTVVQLRMPVKLQENLMA